MWKSECLGLAPARYTLPPMLLPALLLVLGQASQPNEWDTFPPQGPPGAARPTNPPSANAAAPAPAIPDEAKNRYREARDKIAKNDFGGATAILNQLAGQYPKWAAVFSARCVAQAGLRYPQYAVEDCNYALALEPQSAPTLWWLAESEAALGRKEAAAKHYQQYADLRTSEVLPTYRELALKRARELGGAPAAAPAAPEKPAPTDGAKNEIPPPPKTQPEAHHEEAPPPRHDPPGPARTATVAGSCGASGDCHGGQQCKDRGDGVKVCVGKGKNGAFCANSKDCVFPGACKRRHDGVNVCMGGGGAGAFCDEGSDCSGGTWCKPRPDGIKVCTP